MKRATSLILSVFLALSLMPMTFAGALTYHSGQEPPFSLQYFQNVSGLKYVDYETFTEGMASDGEYLMTDYTEETYDASEMLQDKTWEDVLYKVHSTFKKNGLGEGTYTNRDGNVASFYYTEEDERGAWRQFKVFPNESEKLIVIEHAYIIDPLLTLAKDFDKFTKKATYSDGQFTDVKSNDWFASGVKVAYELGLMNGDSETKFNVTGNMTIAETITIASRLNSIYTKGKAEFAQGEVWYMPYVDYAIKNEIIEDGQYSDYNKAISREGFAEIMRAALPLEAWTPINYVEDIPDVDLSTYAGACIYDLYEAGVLTGNDKYGTYYPKNNIQRSEAATILTRMAVPTERKKVQLFVYPTAITMAAEGRLSVGDTRTLALKIEDGGMNTDKTIRWSSSDPTIAVVDNNGTITGRKQGSVVITATTVNGMQASCNMFVWGQAAMDELYASMTYKALLGRLKFPDTLELYNMWAITFTDDDGNYYIKTTIYYSAESAIGIRSRGEYIVYYNVDTLTYFEESTDSSSLHTYERPVNIKNVISR